MIFVCGSQAATDKLTKTAKIANLARIAKIANPKKGFARTGKAFFGFSSAAVQPYCIG